MFRPLKHWGRIIAVPFLIATAQAHAADGEINLSCQGVRTREYGSGRERTEEQPRNVNFTVVVSTQGPRVFITSSGEQLIVSISNRERPYIAIVDYSTDSEWNIVNIFTRFNEVSTYSLIINRLSGLLKYQSVFTLSTGDRVTTIVSANCTKLDPSKKKF